jgi:hypothetical protein
MGRWCSRCAGGVSQRPLTVATMTPKSRTRSTDAVGSFTDRSCAARSDARALPACDQPADWLNSGRCVNSMLGTPLAILERGQVVVRLRVKSNASQHSVRTCVHPRSRTRSPGAAGSFAGSFLRRRTLPPVSSLSPTCHPMPIGGDIERRRWPWWGRTVSNGGSGFGRGAASTPQSDDRLLELRR